MPGVKYWLITKGQSHAHSAETDENNDAEHVVGPETIAFSDDMAGEDFVAWMMAKHAPELPETANRKYLRVAYQVIGRFAQAYVNIKKQEVKELAKQVEGLENIAVAIKVKEKEKSDTRRTAKGG